MAVQYVGPYSPEVYKAANQIQQGGSGTPYTAPIISGANSVLQSQPTQQQAPSQPSSGGGGGTNTNPHINPSTGQWDDNYFASTQSGGGGAPAFDSAPYDNLINSISKVGDIFNTNTSNIITSLQDQGKLQESGLAAQKATADEQNQKALNEAGTQDANLTNEQRRQLSEVQQGIQARYGGGVGTGAFASEIAGAQTSRNIALIHGQLQTAKTNINILQNQILRDYSNNLQKIRTFTQDNIQKAKDDLSERLANLETTKAQVGISKAQQQQAALQAYQASVAQSQSEERKFQQQLILLNQQAQNALDLKAYEVQAKAATKLAGTGSANVGINFSTDLQGRTLKTTYDKQTGDTLSTEFVTPQGQNNVTPVDQVNSTVQTSPSNNSIVDQIGSLFGGIGNFFTQP